MKTASFLILSLAFSIGAQASEVIDKMLDERIAANADLTKELVEEAKEMEESKEVIALEQKNGEDWVAMLKHIKELKDPKLSYLMLRTELQMELLNAHYEVDYAENALQKLGAKTLVTRYTKQLKELEEEYKKLSEKPEKKEKESE